MPLPHEPQPCISVAHPPGSTRTCCGFPTEKCAPQPPGSCPHELSDSWGSFQASQRAKNFRSYWKEMREHICTSCIFLRSQAKRTWKHLLDTKEAPPPLPPPPCGTWSVLRRRGFYLTALLRHSVPPKAEVGSSLWPVPCFLFPWLR